jgi:TonB family protein
MTEAWKQWEGQVVNDEFHLRQYLGGENSAVFLTEHGERDLQKVAIKLLLAPPEKSELQLSQWRLAAKLSHPHLIRLFKMGRCELGNMELLYVVMEYAEEDLSQILPHRPITPAEAREMLEPALDALAYIHGQGFIHGHIKPANIMAVEDQLEISSDGLWQMAEARRGQKMPGLYDAPEIARGEISAAADVWSLGMTIVEALTQRLPVWKASEQREPVLPETLPAPFLELARHCLRRDPQRRWTVADVVAHMHQTSPALQGPTSAIQQTTSATRRRHLVPAVAFGLILAAVLAGPKLFNRQRSASGVGGRSLQRADEKQGSPQVATGQTPVQSEAGPRTLTASFIVPGKVVHQVLPDVPRSARNTIQGKIKVGVRVRVDPSGSVAGVTLAAPGPSRYFAELALKAARRWKFDPARVDDRNVPSEWILRFEFGKTGTKVLSVLAPA